MIHKRLAHYSFQFYLLLGILMALAGTAQAQSFRNYRVTNLVADSSQTAATARIDRKLVNPWGITMDPFGPIRVADNGTGLSTAYTGTGRPLGTTIIIPAPAGVNGHSAPTGVVVSGSLSPTDFPIRANVPATHIFATEDGTIAAWSPALDASRAVLVVNNSTSGTVYKGLALAGDGTNLRLYATDFNHARIDVFDRSFRKVPLNGAFSDPLIPRGFAPFGIQNINGNLYVTYTRQNAAKHDDVPGSGFVDTYDARGVLIRRFAAHGGLSSPWGIALAPADFGAFSNALLVGNFGNGEINAFDLSFGRPLGPLRDARGRVLRIDGLWGIAFGNGVDNQPANTLFFASGPGGEAHGLFGRVDPVRPIFP